MNHNMRRAAIFSPLFAVLLGGCEAAYISSAAVHDADVRAAAVYADCNAQLRSGRLTSHRQAVQCAGERVMQAYQSAGYPFLDLVQFDIIERMNGATQIDVGTQTEDAVNRDLAELEKRINEEAQRRIDVRVKTTGAAADIPLSSLTAGLPSLSGGVTPPLNASDCFKVGSLSNCQGGQPIKR